MVVPRIPQQVGAVRFAPDFHLVTLQHLHQFAECLAASVGHAGRADGWGAQEGVAVKAGEDFGRRAEPLGEAEGEVIGAVAGGGEGVAGDAEGGATYGYEDVGFEELLR